MNLSEIERQLALVRQYNKALESENQSRNQERIYLQNQLQRLNRYIRQLQAISSASIECRNCENLKLQLSKSEQKYSILQKQKKELQSNHDILLSRQLVNRTTVKSTSISSNSSQLIKINYDFDILKRKHTVLEQSEIEYKRKLSEKEEKIRSLQNQITKLNSKLYNLENSIAKYQFEVSELKRRSESKVVTSTPINNSQIQSYKLQISNWKTKYEQFYLKYSSVFQSSQQYKRQLQHKQNTISSLLEQVSQLNSKIYNLQSQIKTHKFEISDLKLKSQQKIVVSTPVKSYEIDSYKTEISNWKTNYEEYYKKYQENNKQIEQTSKRAQQFYVKFTDLNRNYQLLVAQQRRIYDEKTTLQNKVNELERQKIISNSQISKLKSDLQYKNGQLISLKLLYSPSKTQQLQKLKTQNKELKLKIERLTFDMADLKQKQNTLNNNLFSTNKQEKQNQNKKISSFQSEVTMLKEQLKIKQTQIIELRQRRNNQFQEIIVEKDEEIQKFKINVAELLNRIQLLENRPSSQNVRYVTCQTTCCHQQGLKLEIGKLNSIINSYRSQKNIYIQKNINFQRRITVLEEANNNLQCELRAMIEAKSNFHGQRTQVVELRELISRLKLDLTRSREDNNILKQENILILQKLDHLQRLQCNKIMQSPTFHHQENKNYNQHCNLNETNQYLAKSRRKYHDFGTSHVLNGNQQWKNLQKKIAQLKDQNQGLKRTLNDLK